MIFLGDNSNWHGKFQAEKNKFRKVASNQSKALIGEISGQLFREHKLLSKF